MTSTLTAFAAGSHGVSIRAASGNYVAGEWVDGGWSATDLSPRRHRREVAEASTRASTSRDGRVRAARRRAGAAQADLPRARADAQGAGAVSHGAQGEFYAVSAVTGATKTDSWIDIDGGIGTLFAYASRGRRELPDETFYVDGATGAAVARAAPSSAGTSACRSRASPCTSTPSTSPCGECSRSSRRRSSPACRRS